MKSRPDPEESFEEIYPRYPFAELVRLGVALGLRIAAWRLGRLAVREQRKVDKAKHVSRHGIGPFGGVR
jgi:hypothetical protein